MMTMMVKTIVLSLGVLASVVTAIEDNVMEFGRFRVLKQKSRSGWMHNKKFTHRDQALLQTTKQSVDRLDLDDFPWIDTSMSMSMNVPSKYPSEAIVVSPSPTTAPTTMVPTGSPSVSSGPTSSSQPSAAPSVSSAPTSSSSPSAAPSVSSAPTSSSSPSAAPSVSSGPSMSLSAAPSVSHQPSTAPSASAAPTIPPTPAPTSPPTAPPTGRSTPTFFREEVVFTCTDNGVDLIVPPFETATAIDILVVYAVDTFSFLDDYEEDLQNQILASAVIGALGCNTGGPLFGPGGSVPTVNMVTTLTLEACPVRVSLDGTVLDTFLCNVFQTSFQIIVEGDLDPAVDLSAYTFIREEMNSGAFVAAIPRLDRVEYLSPVLPDLLPIETPEIPIIDLDAARQGSITVSPWTIGAVLAMCFGGVMALWVWTRNRSTRHRRHVQLMEDMSLTYPSEAREATTF